HTLGPSARTLIFRLFYASCLQWTARDIVAGLSGQFNSLKLLQHDLTLRWWKRIGYHDSLLYLLGSLLPLHGISVHHYLYAKPDWLLWGRLYDLVVRNWAQFAADNPTLARHLSG